MDMLYDRRSILGNSVYGTVFKGELVNKKDNTKRQVAIKRIELAWYTGSEMDLELLEMNLDHSNVIKLLHIKDDDNFV